MYPVVQQHQFGQHVHSMTSDKATNGGVHDHTTILITNSITANCIQPYVYETVARVIEHFLLQSVFNNVERSE